MRRVLILVAGLALALVPALTGLRGNTSFTQDVPVSVPSQARPWPEPEAVSASRPTTRAHTAEASPTLVAAGSTDDGTPGRADEDAGSRGTEGDDEGRRRGGHDHGRDGDGAAPQRGGAHGRGGDATDDGGHGGPGPADQPTAEPTADDRHDGRHGGRDDGRDDGRHGGRDDGRHGGSSERPADDPATVEPEPPASQPEDDAAADAAVGAATQDSSQGSDDDGRGGHR